MPSYFYTPTVFVPGGAPSVTHIQLNKIGDGIESAHERIDTIRTTLDRVSVAEFAALTGMADGDEYLLEVPDPNRSGSFLLWHLKYDAAEASSYKWLVVSAAPLTKRGTSSQSVTATTYTALSDPTIDLPRAGDYEFDIRAKGAAVNNTDVYSYLAPKPNGQSASDTDGLLTVQTNAYDTAFNTKVIWSGATKAVRQACASGTCQIAGRNTLASKQFDYENIILSAAPIRLGQGTT